MRPNQIVVFDGLRITTQHVNHLQSAINSSVYELRAIAGAGRVHEGFDVVAEGANSVTVQPGLAYDKEANRIVSDDPIRLAVGVAANEASYVVVRYKQVRDGEVEGKPTLIFDSCEASVIPTVPADEDSAIVLARVTRSANGGLEISTPSVGEPSAEPENISQPETPKVTIDQGIVHLPFDDQAYDAAAMLASALRRNPAGGSDLTVVLASSEVALPFAPRGITVDALLRATLTAGAAAHDESSKPAQTRFQTIAHGEATLSTSKVKQHGLSQIATETEGSPPRHRTDLAENRIAYLTLTGSEPAEADAWRDHVAFIVRIEPSNNHGFHVTCSLAWDAEGGEQRARQIETGLAGFTWLALVAWKAVGDAAVPGAANDNLPH